MRSPCSLPILSAKIKMSMSWCFTCDASGRSMAHLYHYYLHGEQGNLAGASQHSREETPKIVVECIAGTSQLWSCALSDVGDDLETLYLQVSYVPHMVSLFASLAVLSMRK